MSARFHYYSHLENLESGVLVLTDPFLEARVAPLLCRYALHRQSADVLAPDPEFAGLARWHRLLPFDREAVNALPDQALFELETLPPGELCARHILRPDGRWPYWAARAALAQSRCTQALALSPDGVARCLRASLDAQALSLYLPAALAEAGDQPLQGSLAAAWRLARANTNEVADLGPWGNPYRIEAWKALGLELAQRGHELVPTVLVHDPCGELLAGLIQAAEHLMQFRTEPPYRLIALLQRPFHQLAQRFEGAAPDWDALEADNNRACLPLAKPVARLLCEGLTRLRGTVVVLEAGLDQAELFETALARLTRAHFLDEEDVVYQLSATY